MTTKSWYQSKTIWFNALTILVAVAAYFGWTPDQNVTSQVSGFLVAIAPLANIVLRLVTKEPISTPAAQ